MPNQQRMVHQQEIIFGLQQDYYPPVSRKPDFYFQQPQNSTCMTNGFQTSPNLNQENISNGFTGQNAAHNDFTDKPL